MAQPTSVALTQLAEVGEQHLPDFADTYRVAAEKLHQALSAGLFASPLFDATGQEWVEAGRDLEDILVYTEDALRESARAILQVIKNYDRTDAESSDRLGAIDR